uniref:Ig-like domain-containing protein n=1 Tax=Pygocentrus nattereri TaxID=42514 RepID=A0AAR2LSA4_PYGNA
GMTARFQFNFFNIFLFPGDTSAQTVVPLEGEIHVSEGDNVTLSCNYSNQYGSDVLQWYRQFPRSGPEFLLSINLYASKSDPPPRMSDNRVDLLISSAAVSDSALYYCALQPTVTGNPATLYKKCFMQSSVLVRRGSLLLAIGPYSFPKHYICTPSQRLINGSWVETEVGVEGITFHFTVMRMTSKCIFLFNCHHDVKDWLTLNFLALNENNRNHCIWKSFRFG